MKLKKQKILGLYSDPSALALELAVIESDGLDIQKVVRVCVRPYPHELRELILAHRTSAAIDSKRFNLLRNQVTQFFIQEAQALLQQLQTENILVDLIGLSGQAALHDPEQNLHLTFCDAQEISNALQIPVVHHFVKEDLNAGGVGSPLLATFWATLCGHLKKPLAVVVLGGVTHLVYIGPVGELVGFDVNAGLALLDAWVFRRTGQELDFDGILGAKGKVDERVLKVLLESPFLQKEPPKSVRRVDAAPLMNQVEGLSVEDGAATLTAFTAQAIAQSQHFLPQAPEQWIFIGGGTYNATLMLQLAQLLPNVVTGKEVFQTTEALNAMGFAFIAARYQARLPISFPSTTGVSEPVAGGELALPQA